jgi:lichenan operon transcriptional antiterminator
MFILNHVQVLLLRNLLNTQEPLSSEVLAVSLGTAAKTIRSNIDMIDKILQLAAGARIVSKTGSGIYLDVFDSEEFRVFSHNFNLKYLDDYYVPNKYSERITHITRRLLFSMDRYITIDTLCEELYVSRVTISCDLRKIRKDLARYHLEIKNRASHGIKITGQESHMRIAMADYLEGDEDNVTQGEIEFSYFFDPRVIADIVVPVLLEKRILIANNSLMKLVRLLLVSDFRIQNGFPIADEFVSIENITETDEYFTAKAILDTLKFDRTEHEIIFIALFILSRRNFTQQDSFNIQKIPPYCNMSTSIIEWIFETTGTDFANYPKISIGLACHLRGLYYRLSNGMEKRDLQVFEARRNHLAFEYAIVASEYLMRYWNIMMPSGEIAYLAYRFYLPLETLAPPKKKNVLVALVTGLNASDFFIGELLKNWSKYIDNVHAVELYQIPYMDVSFYDCLITDVLTDGIDISIPVINVNHFFKDRDYLFLKDFFETSRTISEQFMHCFREELFVPNIVSNSPEDVIAKLCKRAGNSVLLDEDPFPLVMRREAISSTEQGNSVAIPHTLRSITGETFFVVGVLKKPILWEREKCQLVILVINGKNENTPFSMLSFLKTATQNIHFVYNLIRGTSFEDLRSAILLYLAKIRRKS